jgi:hypothetical protein
LGWRRGSREAWAHAAAGIRGQGELADKQQTTPGIGQGTVHLAGIVGEHAVTKQPLCHSRDLGVTIAWLDCHERQQAGTDRPDHGIVHGHLGFGHALDQSKHGASLCDPVIPAKAGNPFFEQKPQLAGTG